MGYCMTKSIMLSMLAVLPLFGFSDFVEDCENQKIAIYTDLYNLGMSTTYSWSDARFIIGVVNSARHNLGNLSSNLSSADSQTITSVEGNLQVISDTATIISNRLFSSFNDIQFISNRVASIDCTACTPSEGGLGCCDTISNIWNSVSNIHYNTDISVYMLHSISNDLKSIISVLRANTNILSNVFGRLDFLGNFDTGPNYMQYAFDSDGGFNFDDFMPNIAYLYYNSDPFLISDSLENININLADSLSSINNYLYRFFFLDFPSYATTVTENLIPLTDSTTNFFSLFQGEAVMADYWKFPSTVRREVSYYQFLTNHYIAVSQGEQFYDYQGVSVEITKTNWMDRIETLIAAIVFNDGGAVSNTVNPFYEQDDPDGLIQTMSEAFTGLENDPQSALSALRDTSQSLVSSISRFSSAFHDASMPGTVRLVNFGASSPSNRSADSSSGSGDSVEFSTSDGGTFFEMCRCATTIAWTLGGLILVVVFLSWAAHTSYKMFIFCWDVFNGIFGR